MFRRIHILGAGKLGQTLGHLFYRLGFSIGQVICQTTEKASLAVQFIGAGSPQTTFTVEREPAFLFLSVPDRKISEVVHSLLGVSLDSWIVLHFSGSLPSSLLSPLKKNGVLIGSIHPLKSFASPEEAVRSFPGTFCSYEGDCDSLPILSGLIEQLGGIPFSINTSKKIYYHLGAVVASNYLVGLFQFALDLYKKAGISSEEGFAPLWTLMEGTFVNLKKLGIEKALTGPLQRGDISTIEKHLEVLSPEEACLYALLGIRCLSLTNHSPEIEQSLRLLFQKVLEYKA